MVEAHSSRSNESTSSRRNSAPGASATRNTTIRDRFGSIVRGQRRHNPLARSSSANNQALHDLSEMMGEITAVAEAYAVDESHRHTESVAIEASIDTYDMKKLTHYTCVHANIRHTRMNRQNVMRPTWH